MSLKVSLEQKDRKVSPENSQWYWALLDEDGNTVDFGTVWGREIAYRKAMQVKNALEESGG